MSLGLKASADGTQITLQLGGVDLLTLSAAGVVAGPLASDAEAQALSSLLKLLTPGKLNSAFQGANQSLGTNGYQKLPGGLIIQWGNTASLTSGSSNTITLPVAFPNACQSVTYCANTQNGSGASAQSITTKTTTSFSLWANALVSTAYNWIAIGY